MKEKVKIDGDFVNAYLHRNKFTAKEFSAHLGKSQSWWSYMNHYRNYIVSKEMAEMMCEHFGFNWDELVADGQRKAPPEKPAVDSWEQEEDFKSDNKETDIQIFMQILVNLDERMRKIECLLENLQWLKK